MSKILIKNITIQNPFENSFVSDVLIEDGIISKIAENIISEAQEIINGTEKILTLGMIDRHTHGGYDCNFNTCDEDALQNYLINLKKHGIVAVVPTIMTDSIENINKQIALLKSIKSKGAKILGVHLEGPFINPLKKGIHPEKYILAPTIENLNKIDTDFIKVLTFAPELDKEKTFLNELKKRGIIASIGHSNATFEQAQNAFQSGVTQVTHLFNAMKSIHHREPALLTEALINDEVSVEIIADLQHIHRAVLQMILKLKPMVNILFISDSLPISYSDKKEDVFGGEVIFYDSEKATSKDGVLAGSTLFLDDIYKKVADFIEFKNFIGFASKNIAKSLDIKGFDKIEEGTEFSDTIFWNKKDILKH